MNYGVILFQLRDRLGLTKRELSKVLGISDSLYSRYEKEEQTIPIKHLNTLCNYFDISIDYILDFTDIKKHKISNTNINLKKSGERLKKLRKENRLTQSRFASILNIDNSMISKYEKGKYTIATTYLYQICSKYHISADYLLGKTDEPKYLK